MKGKFYFILLTALLFSIGLFAQNCDCDIFPIKPECKKLCGPKLLQSGSKQQLQNELKLTAETAQKITSVPDRASKTSVKNFKNTLPERDYLELENNYYNWTNNTTIIQVTETGNNVAHDLNIIYNINNNAVIAINDSLKNKLLFHTSQIENVKFLFNTVPWDIEVDNAGEDMITKFNQFDLNKGLGTQYSVTNSYPRIPASYMFINFSVENHGADPLRLEHLETEIINKFPIPATARVNYYKKILDTANNIVEINPDEPIQPIAVTTRDFAHNTINDFRVKIEVSNDSIPAIYEFKITVVR